MSLFNDDLQQLANQVRMSGELACLLEVSATPKPGNVHRFRDFEDTRYEHFLASSVTLGRWLEELALKGAMIEQGKLNWQQLELGKTIKEAIISSNFFHKGGNTNLGIILLLSPLSVSAGFTLAREDHSLIPSLRKNTLEVMKRATIEDAINVSEGIAIVSPGGLGRVERYDVNSPDLREELMNDKITLLELMRKCKKRDNICLELAEGYPITFKTGFRALMKSFNTTNDINIAIIDAYLEILSAYPDSLILRKFGEAKAREIAAQAKEIIKKGGAKTVEGRRELEEFDIQLREEEELVNPGTTADLIAATLFVFLLLGMKI